MFPGILCQNVAAKVHEQELCAYSLTFSVHFQRDLTLHRVDIPQIDILAKLSARFTRRLFQFARDCAHSADRYFPFTSLVADQMIKKATVLKQRRIMW